MLGFICEGALNILDDAVDKELDAIDDLMHDAGQLDVAAQIIPDALVDAETDNTDFEKYMDREV